MKAWLIIFGLLVTLRLLPDQTSITLCLTNNSLLNGSLVGETASNLVVAIDGVNQTFATSQIRWQERKAIPAPIKAAAAGSVSPAPIMPTNDIGSSPAAASPADYAHALEDVRQKVIATHKMEAYREPKKVDGKWELAVDPNSPEGAKKFSQANAYYDQTMAGVANGSISQNDLVLQAKKVLAQCDQYQEERQNDPQYEAEITKLREFVRRSDAGEKFNFNPIP